MNLFDKICEVAEHRKNDPAMEYGDQVMTYGEFALQFKNVAVTLGKLGITTGDRVAVALPRSFDTIIAIMGCLGAGTTFIPIDPLNPVSTLHTILEDSKPAVIISDKHHAGKFTSSGIKVLTLDECVSGEPFKPSDQAKVAYIIYTSGTTGKPKGVIVSHDALENYLDWATTHLPFTNGGVPLFTSVSFDHAITNIFPPLLMGDRIVILPPISGGKLLASLLLEKRHATGELYSYVKITPSIFLFLNDDQKADLGRLTNLLMFGGERLTLPLVVSARRENPDLIILNHYGPTEATVGCCVFQIPGNYSQSVIPIGSPIPGVQVSIRNEDFSLSHKNEPGELYVSGAALSEGYWQQPDITARYFLTLTDKDGQEKKWYHTGDLVRLNDNGEIECLGRMDDQVKILGHRIEPAEIAGCINRMPGIRQVEVFCHDHRSNKELVAAIVLSDESLTTESVRDFLKTVLPGPQVPTHILILDELPLAASGKLDIRALTRLLKDEQVMLDIEQAIIAKFREMLGIENISIDDDYFMSGGDSLGAVEIVVWANEKFGVDVEISSLFNFSSASSFACHIKESIVNANLNN